MKKILFLCFALFLMAALAVSTCAKGPNPMTEVPANDGEVLFSSGADAADLSTDQPGSTELSVVDAGDGKVIQLKRIAENGIIAVWIEPASFIDCSDCAWLEFWIDISEYSPDSDFYPVFRCFDGIGACVDSFAGGDYIEYRYQEDGAWAEGYIDPYGRMTIPGGYKGYIRIALDQLLESTSTMAGNGAVFDPAYFCRFVLWTDQNDLGVKDISVYLGNFRFVKDKERVTEEKEEIIEDPAPEQPLPPTNGGMIKALDGSMTGFGNLNSGVQDVTSVVSGNKTLIKMKTLRKGGDPGIIANFDPIDASGMQFLQFWFDCSAISTETPVELGMRIFDSKGAYADVYGADGNVNYYLYVDGEWVTYTSTEGMSPRFPLPVGYSGYIRIDMTQFKDCVTVYIGNGNPLDMSCVSGFWLWYAAAEEQVGRSSYLNDFKFVNAGTDEEPVDTAPVVTEPITTEPIVTEPKGTESAASDTGAVTTDAETADSGSDGSPIGLIIGIAAAVIVIAAIAIVLAMKKKKK